MAEAIGGMPKPVAPVSGRGIDRASPEAGKVVGLKPVKSGVEPVFRELIRLRKPEAFSLPKISDKLNSASNSEDEDAVNLARVRSQLTNFNRVLSQKEFQ